MALNDLQNITTSISFPHNGPTNSEDMQDFTDSTVRDLAIIAQQWNDTLAPLINTLPGGTRFLTSDLRSETPDAFINGLDGANLYVDLAAKPSDALGSFLYDSTNARPVTIKEAIISLKSSVDDLVAPGDESETTDSYYLRTNFIPYLLSTSSLFTEFYLVDNTEVTTGTITYPASYPGIVKLSTGVDNAYVPDGAYIDCFLMSLLDLSRDGYTGNVPNSNKAWSFVNTGESGAYPGYEEGDFLVYLTSAPSTTTLSKISTIINNGTYAHTKLPTTDGLTNIQIPSAKLTVEGGEMNRGADFTVGSYSSLYKLILLSSFDEGSVYRVSFVSTNDTATIGE